MPHSRYTRAETGDSLFTHLATEDPYGPGFDPALVARGDLLVYRLIESEQRHGEIVEWSLYAGDELLAERIEPRNDRP